jgi:pyruvoyl-dependent arginine decarboxylase (PvlArgDC)
MTPEMWLEVIKLIIKVTAPVFGIVFTFQAGVIWFAVRSYIKSNSQEHTEMKNAVTTVSEENKTFRIMIAEHYATKEDVKEAVDPVNKKVDTLFKYKDKQGKVISRLCQETGVQDEE